MDIIICQSAKLDILNETSDTVGNYLRYRQIRNYYKNLNDIVEFQKTMPNVNYRFLIVPSKSLGSIKTEISFNNATTAPMMKQGQEDAAMIMGLGKKTSFDLLNQWSSDPKIKEKHKHFSDFLHSQ